MAAIDEIDITALLFQEGSAPSTPASTKWRLYFKSDGLYVIDDAGTEVGPLGEPASGNDPARVWLTDASTQAISTSTSGGFQTVAFDTETEDTDGFHTGSAGIVIPAGLNGRPMVFGANVGLAANATGARQAQIVKNVAGSAVTLAYVTGVGSSSISFREVLVTPAFEVATGDTIDVQVWQNSGGDLATVNANGLPSLFGYTVD